ncbi:hypothetical protein M2322_003214 [Rhodoblastus acidophilus]|uniref:hypothetical protein n=1 Tax=Rhodoblastus acidophilus TaxID=1074 RepID=UPI002225A5AC|nr:hypothetical protein [Rhodoblastus acidophilus]MCW2317650.1 hypothetical protein [Rhodoblastus acidophilus]
MTEDYAHFVSIDRKLRRITIERIFPNGRREMFTTMNVPDVSSERSGAVIDKLAFELGDNILLDSPAARELLEL